VTSASIVQLVVLALWLGAAALFTLVVAPAAFATLPSRELAGALVGRVLPVLFWSGATTGVVVLVIELRSSALAFRRTRIGMSGALVIACLAAQLAVAPRIAGLRAAMTAPLASLAANDPQRILFGRLHMFSVAWLGVAMIAALACAALLTMTSRPRASI